MQTESDFKFQLSSEVNLQIVVGDITELQVDAIVNAANSQLIHGGGVAGAIAKRGGETINAESQQWVRKFGPVKHNHPAYTSAGHLPSRYVIHAVGPIWGEGDEDIKLKQAILGSLKLALKLEIKSIAFPAISTGIFGFPLDKAAEIFARTIISFFASSQHSSLSSIIIVLVDRTSYLTFVHAFQAHLEELGSDI